MKPVAKLWKLEQYLAQKIREVQYDLDVLPATYEEFVALKKSLAILEKLHLVALDKALPF